MTIQLHKIAYILYFFLLCVFISYVFIQQGSSHNVDMYIVVMLFNILLVPLWEYVYDFGRDYLESYSPKNLLDILVDFGVPILGVLIGMGGFISYEFLLIVFGILALWRKFEAKIFFIGALLVFCYVALFLIFGIDTQAENLSIFAYYLLVAGVIIEIGQSFLYPRSEHK